MYKTECVSMRKSTLSVIFALVLSLFVLTGCNTSCFLNNDNSSESPGSALPVTVFFEGNLYSHDGYVIYELPENIQYLEETNCIGNSTIPEDAEDFDATAKGYIYDDINNSDPELFAQAQLIVQ